jgi:hypothetical protein
MFVYMHRVISGTTAPIGKILPPFEWYITPNGYRLYIMYIGSVEIKLGAEMLS